jgi:hypothetical protein
MMVSPGIQEQVRMSEDIEQKARAYLSRVEQADAAGQALGRRRADLAHWSEYWRVREESWRGEDPAAAQEAGQAAALLTELIAPALDRLEALPQAEQGRLLNLMVPFDAEGGLRDFLLHFFQMTQDDGGGLVYQARDPFERELYVLHDLYKVKKTLDVIETIRRASRHPDSRFPSRFSAEQRVSILNRLEEVLSLMFTQTLPPRHRQVVVDGISPAYLSAEELLRRRESGLLYTYPHVLERYDYRRFFFLIYFKEGLRARFDQEERTYRYNFLHFQWLKREFLIHWLEARLRGNSRKFRAYSQYEVRGRSLLSWLAEEPERESELLMEMPTPAFHAMVGQINEELPDAERIGFDPETEKFGLYHRLRAQLREAAALAKAPLQTLRQIVADAGAGTRAAPGAPAPPPAPSPETVPAQAAAPPPEPPREPHWEITLLDKARIAQPFLIASAQGYATQLAALRARMGAAYGEFAAFVSRLLEVTPEMSTLRRRTPKHEWTLPYQIRRILPGETREYLLVIGAEVKAKPRGMGYQTRESYQFTPYFVFASAQAEEGFGAPTGERYAVGKAFTEHSIAAPAVMARARELIALIRERTKM